MMLINHLENALNNDGCAQILTKRQEKLKYYGLMDIKKKLEESRKGSNLIESSTLLKDAIKYDKPLDLIIPDKQIFREILRFTEGQTSLKKASKAKANNDSNIPSSNVSPLIRKRAISDNRSLPKLSRRKDSHGLLKLDRFHTDKDHLQWLAEELKGVLKDYTGISFNGITHLEHLREISQLNPAIEHIRIYIDDPTLIDCISSHILMVDRCLPKNISLLIHDLSEYLRDKWDKNCSYVSEKIRVYSKLVENSKAILNTTFVQRSFKDPAWIRQDARMEGIFDTAALDVLNNFKTGPAHCLSDKVNNLDDHYSSRLEKVHQITKLKGSICWKLLRKMKEPLQNSEYSALSKGLTKKMEREELCHGRTSQPEN